MKKTISLMLCLLLILSSVNFVFASATSWDTTDAANLQSIKNTLTNTTSGTIYYMISQINAAMRFSNKTLANWLSDIYNSLNNNLLINDSDVGRQSVTYWVREAVLDLDALVGTGSGTLLYNISQLLSNSNTIKQGVQSITNTISTMSSSITQIETDVAGILITSNQTLPGIYAYAGNIDVTTGTYLPMLEPLAQALTNYKPGTAWSNVTQADLRSFSHVNLIDDLTTGRYTVNEIQSDGSINNRNIYWGNGTPIANLAAILKRYTNSFVAQHSYLISNFWKDTASNDWIAGSKSNFYTLESRSANLTTQQNTPLSFSDRLFKYLQKTQYDTARLSYVLASDFDIDASQKAQSNQEAVVDNFIDPNGSGAASASDIADIADLSSGYSQTFSTDASATGIFNIFNSDHMGWFSQETKNQLDTTNNNRKSNIVDTPLLDKQIEDIYNSLGVKQP